MKKASAVLVMGSNFGEREAILQSSLSRMADFCSVVRRSEIYESNDCLGKGRKYLNIVLQIATLSDEPEIIRRLKLLECEFGRTLESRERGEVPLDIDIVIWNGEIRRPVDFKSAYFICGYKKMNAD